MKISIIGSGNMGGAIACGLANCIDSESITLTVIDHKGKNVDRLHALNSKIKVIAGKYDSLSDADLVIIAVKPQDVENVLTTHKKLFGKPNQIIVSTAGGITLAQLAGWVHKNAIVYRIIPNTAIALKQSMSFICSRDTPIEQDSILMNLFSQLGIVEFIDESLFPAAATLGSSGIAYAIRYIRAAMEGGIEIGLHPVQAKKIVLQTIKGAIELLENDNTHPEVEIDKVTTAGGTTIKGLNEMERAGFSSSVIRGLKASL